MRTRTRTLKRTLLLALAQTAVVTTCVGGSLLIMDQHQRAAGSPIGATDSNFDGRGNAKGSPQWLLDRHADECWTAEQDAKAEIPGHVIARGDDEVSASYRSDLVDAALSELDGSDHGVLVYAYCV